MTPAEKRRLDATDTVRIAADVAFAQTGPLPSAWLPGCAQALVEGLLGEAWPDISQTERDAWAAEALAALRRLHMEPVQ